MGAAKWRDLGALKTGAVRDWTSANLFRCDPYLVWADAVTSPIPRDELGIAILVELRKSGDYKEFFERMNRKTYALNQLRFLPTGFEPHPASRFVTGLVNRRGLAELIDAVLEGRIERFSLQNSREDIAQATRGMWPHATRQLQQSLASAVKAARAGARVAARVATGRPANPATRTGTYLGIIDDGLPFLRVRDSVGLASRPAHLWDQGWRQTFLVGTEVNPGDPPDPGDPYWQNAWEASPIAGGPGQLLFQGLRGYLYGRRLKELPLTKEGRSDRDEYFLSRYFAPAPQKTHGAGVLGLMAPWLSGARGKVSWPKHISGLAMVQLPTNTVLDTSGGSLAMRVIEGLRYILWQESSDRNRGEKERPVVVNISYGIHAGPHDGSSMFERALVEMLNDHPRLHVVLPVGNATQAGCHARRVLRAKGKPGDASTIALEVCADNGRDTFVEFWVPRGSKVALSIRPPGSNRAFRIREGEARIHFDAEPDDPDMPRIVHFGAIYSAEVAQGTNAAMALLAIAPTRRVLQPAEARGLNQQLRREALGASGLWQLTLENLADRETTVDAWVERDDAPPDVPVGSRQAYFPDTCCGETRLHNATPENTVNGIATPAHKRLHVVGAMRRDGALSEYSAAGAGRGGKFRSGPDVVATGDWSKNLPGLRTTGFLRGAIARIDGTSAACAVYTRALACQLGSRPAAACDGPMPGDPPPEISCTTNSQPQADPLLRGQDKRRLFPFGIEL